MRIMGLDYGDKAIGVAASDSLGLIAQGVTTIRRDNENSFKKLIRELSEIISEYKIEKIVLGFPKNMDNSQGVRCEKTLAFKERLERNFKRIPVVLWDERLSTVAAGQILKEAGIKREKRNMVIDMSAAVYILQGYLDSITNKKEKTNE